MSLSRQTMLDLMAYADGELPAEERARVEQLLASSADARRVVGSFNDLGDWVDEAYEQPSAVLSNAIATVVMARVKSLPQPARAPSVVVDLASARRTRIVTVVVAAAALAAGVMLYNRDDRTARSPDPAPAPPVPALAPASRLPKIEVAAAGGVDVEHVESPTHEVSVFYLPAVAAANASSVVVWIGDDDKGAP